MSPEEILRLTGPAVLLACHGKKPLLQAWQKMTLGDMTPAYLDTLRNCNVGVSLGQPSRGLISIDFDDDDALEVFLQANPSLRGTLYTRGARGGNLWLRIQGDLPRSTRLVRPDGGAAGEWRSTGNQTIIQGRHPRTGRDYTMVQAAPPILVEAAELRWPIEVRPKVWPGDIIPVSECDKECEESKESEDTFACITSGSSDLYHTEKEAMHTGLAVIAAEHAFASNNRPGVLKLYAKLVEARYKPQASARNDFITHAVPFLYRAVSEELVRKFSAQFYRSNQLLFNDPLENHVRETEAMIEGVAQSYLDSIPPSERDLYVALDPRTRAAYRICGDLAVNLKKNDLPPSLFFMTAQGMADRLDCLCAQGQRHLHQLIRIGVIAIETPGSAHTVGMRGRPTVYRWLKALKVRSVEGARHHAGTPA